MRGRAFGVVEELARGRPEMGRLVEKPSCRDRQILPKNINTYSSTCMVRSTPITGGRDNRARLAWVVSDHL